MRPSQRGTAILIALLLALFFAAPAAAKGTKGRYVDKRHGFSLKLMKKWSQTPTQPGETLEVAKFKEKRKGGYAELSVYRFVNEEMLAESTPGPEGEGEDSTPPPPRVIRPGMPKSGYELVSGFVKRVGNGVRQRAGMMGVTLKKGTIPEMPEAREIKFGPSKGELYIAAFAAVPKIRSPALTLVVGIVTKGHEEYTIVYQAPRKLKGGQLNSFIGAVRSFRCPGDADVEADDRKARGGVVGKKEDLIDLEKRKTIKAALVGTWKYIDTKHYIIIYNCEWKLARQIADRIEFMRSYAFEKVFPPVEPIEECMVVRVCKEFDEYYHYGGPRGSGGYWASYKDEFVLPKLPGGIDVTIGVLNHEGFHQYVYYALLKHNPPVWFNEGYAEYFFTVSDKATPKNLRFESRHPMRYGVIKSALGTGKVKPSKEFINLTHQQYMAESNLCYAQGWAFASWLKNVTTNKRYREIPVIYFQEMQRGYKAQKDAGIDPMMGGRQNQVTKDAMEKAFEGIDLDQLHADFLRDLKKKM